MSYDSHRAGALNRPMDGNGIEAAYWMFELHRLPRPEVLGLSPHCYLCGLGEDVVVVRCSAQVDRWAVWVVLLCEALLTAGREVPTELQACATLALAVGAVEVLR